MGGSEASKRLRVDGGHELDPEELVAQLERDFAADARVHAVVEDHARLVAAEQLAVKVGMLDRGALRPAKLTEKAARALGRRRQRGGSHLMALLDDEHELEGRLAVCVRHAVGRGKEVARTLPDVRAVHLQLRLGVHQRFKLSPHRIGAKDELLAALAQDACALPQNRAPLGLRPRHILVRADLRVDWCSGALGVRRVDANQIDAGIGQRFDQLEARAIGEHEIVAACDRACCRAARPRVHSKREPQVRGI